MAEVKKQIIYKVKNSSGDFITTWDDTSFNGFTKEINGGLGECVITLGRKFDYTGSDLRKGNIVEIYIGDRETREETMTEKKIYSGYISLIEPLVEGNDERIIVHLLGLYTKLSLDILKNGNQTTLFTDSSAGLTTTNPGSAADLGLIMRAIIDRYRAERSDPILNYGVSTIPDVGTDGYYKLEQKTYREAMNKIKSVAPRDYFYYIDEENKVHFRQKPSSATHRFTFGKEVISARVQNSLEKVRNFILIWDGQSGGVFKHYQDQKSIELYGRRAERLIDYGIQNSNTADEIGSKFIEENKDPEVRIVVEIADNSGNNNVGYDIESISPGDTCTFQNIDDNLYGIFQENMLISRVSYFLDRVEIVAEIRRASLIELQQQIKNSVDNIETQGSPTTYS